MKKLLALTPAFLLLAACATTAPTTVSPTPAYNFICADNGKIIATYSENGQVATLDMTLPKVGLNHQKITLNQAISGSGARYTNTTNPDVSYEWHTKSDYGIITIAPVKGQKYAVNCTL